MVLKPVAHRPLADIENDLALAALRLDDAVVELADGGRVTDIAVLLAARIAMSVEEALRVLEAVPERPAALLCRAAGVSLNGYSALLRMRRRNDVNPLTEPTALMNAYLVLTRPSASELPGELEAGRASPQGDA